MTVSSIPPHGLHTLDIGRSGFAAGRCWDSSAGGDRYVKVHLFKLGSTAKDMYYYHQQEQSSMASSGAVRSTSWAMGPSI